MKTCKDCLHNEMCYDTHIDDSPTCCDFTDCSKWVPLPFKCGDKAYTAEGLEITITRVIVFMDKKRPTNYRFKCRYRLNNNVYDYFFDDREIGKTVFFIREEAEKALRGAESDAD